MSKMKENITLPIWITTNYGGKCKKKIELNIFDQLMSYIK